MITEPELREASNRARSEFEEGVTVLREAANKIYTSDKPELFKLHFQAAHSIVSTLPSLLREYERRHTEWQSFDPSKEKAYTARFQLLIEADEHQFSMARSKIVKEMFAIADLVGQVAHSGIPLDERGHQAFVHQAKEFVNVHWRLASKLQDDAVTLPLSGLGASCFKHIVKVKLDISHHAHDSTALLRAVEDEIRWVTLEVLSTNSPGSHGKGKFTNSCAVKIEEVKR